MAKSPAPAPPARKGVLASPPGASWSAREEWSTEGPPDARRFSASGEQRGEDHLAWSISALLGKEGTVDSIDLQVRPVARPSEVTTCAFRCFGGAAFGTTIGPGGVPEKMQTAFPPGSAFRGFSFALDALTAASRPLRLGHGRRLLVIELDTGDLQPRVRDWMVLAVSKERAGPAPDAPWALVYEFRPADAPGRAHTTVAATAEGVPVRASRAARGGTLDVLPDGGNG